MIDNPPEWLQLVRAIGAKLEDGLRENPSWIAFARENGTVYHTYTLRPPTVRRPVLQLSARANAGVHPPSPAPGARTGIRTDADEMAKLIYSAIASLDGYVEDPEGKFEWAEPDEEVHAFLNDLERPVGTYLYGRRMYETMVFWETAELTAQPPFVHDFAGIWRGADKVVYSRRCEG